jgi:hypothetical protein
MIQKSKQRFNVKVINTKTGKVMSDAEETSTHGPVIFFKIPKKIGAPDRYIVEVEYLGEKHFKVAYAKRLAVQTRNQELNAKYQKEQAEQALVLRQNRIMNQIELAFEKKGKHAVLFVTCDQCEAPATLLGLTHENPGSAVIAAEQITGAMCASHNNNYYRPFKTTVVIECSRLEFFYDGLKQIYVKKKVA